jgi:hypothetical protein
MGCQPQAAGPTVALSRMSSDRENQSRIASSKLFLYYRVASAKMFA